MADIRNLTPEELEKQNKLLTEREQILQRIEERNKRIAVAGADEIKRLSKRNETDKARLDILGDELDAIEDITDGAKDYVKFWEKAAQKQQDYQETQEDFATSFAKLSDGMKETLLDSNNGANQFAAITGKILQLKKQQINADDETNKSLQQRINQLSAVRQTQIDAAEQLDTEKTNFFGINDAARRRIEFQTKLVGLSDEDRQMAEEIYKYNENLIQQQERLAEIKKQANNIVSSLPEGLQSIVTGISDLVKGIASGLGPVVIVAGLLALVISQFTELAAASKKFRQETGLTKDETKNIDNQVKSIRNEFSQLGVEAEDVYDTIKALKKEFSDNTDFSRDIVSSIVVLNKNLGVAQEDAAGVNSLFQQMAGLSATTAQGVSMQVAEMAKIAGVAPSQVFKDIADSAEESLKYFRGDINALAKAAIEARRLGTNIKSVVATTSKLLDFESGIEKELVAATFVGGQFNLTQARALAYAGKQIDAQKEILRQVQRTGNFRDKDPFTQQALADAVGMTVEELNKQLLMQEKLVGLSDEQKKLVVDAMDKGLDLTNMNDTQLRTKVKELEKQEQIADSITQMENSFKGIAASLATGFVPLMEGLAPIITIVGNVFGFIFKMLNAIPGLFPAIIAGLTTMYILSKKAALMKMKEAIAGMFSKSALLPGLGVALAVGAVAAMMAAVNSAKVGDMAIQSAAGGGETTISTSEGGIYSPSRNDQVAVGPGVVDRLKKAEQLSTLAATPVIGGGMAGQAINVLVQEMKALRADMNSGKIKANTYLDGQKVTTGLSNASELSTRNNFSYGQRV
ncbi:MAG: hypothetical protein RLZ08_847 [Pseudomonadota bacterium]|jgi:hypothetical protein